MTIEWWLLPGSLGGHRVQAAKTAVPAYQGYYSVKVPGLTSPILVPGHCLQPVLPDEPPKGSLVLGRNGAGRVPWSAYMRLTDSTSFGDHHWALADQEREMYTWQRIHKDHSEVVVLINAGAGRVDWETRSCGNSRVRLKEDNDGDFGFTLNGDENVYEDADVYIEPQKLREMACAILSRVMGGAT